LFVWAIALLTWMGASFRLGQPREECDGR
jgi:hypothetical protein